MPDQSAAILVVDGGPIDSTAEVARITGMKNAIKSDTDTICFFDLDSGSITPEWADKLVAGIADGADECRELLIEQEMTH